MSTTDPTPAEEPVPDEDSPVPLDDDGYEEARRLVYDYLRRQAEAPHEHHPLDGGAVLTHSHPWDPGDEDVFASLPTHSHAGHYGAVDR